MEGIVKALEQIEKFIYKILLWAVLLPKTLILIVLHPDEVPKYVRQELGEGESRFDEYFSPIVLFLVVALVPFVIWNFIPTSGVEVVSPSIDNPTPNRTVDFYANTDFRSTSPEGFVTYFWGVEQEVFDQEQYFYPSIRLVRHTSDSNALENSEDFTYFYQIDNNTVQDFYSHSFPPTGGSYWVTVTVYKTDAEGNLVEQYYDEKYVYVPENSQENVVVSGSSNKKSGDEIEFKTENLVAVLQDEKTIFLALGIFIIPLTFALATRFLGKQNLNEDSLKDAFYIQCYYFSPIAVLFWATQYAILFLTPDIFGYYTAGYLLIYLPLILGVVWLVSVETYLFATERQIDSWQALLIVLGCASLLGLGALYIVNVSVPGVQEGTRKIAIWFYPLLGILVLTTYHLLVARRRKLEAKKFTIKDWGLVFMSIMIVFLTITVILVAGREITQSSQFDSEERAYAYDSAQFLTAIATERESQQGQNTEVPAAQENLPIPEPVVAGATSTPEQISAVDAPSADQATPAATSVPDQTDNPSIPVTGGGIYFTEEFDGNLDSWPYFMTQGDETALNYYIDAGRLYFQLLQHNDQRPRIYFMNTASTYTDVQIETVTTNSGVNTNGVGLICRFGDAGWYEFVMSNSGLYTIYAVDATNQFYYALSSGGSPAINTGLAENKYTAKCEGSELTLYVNDALVATVTDDIYNFREGYIGFSVYSPQGLPVSIDFSYIKVSEP
jgi:hypothetical protein